MRRVDLAKHLVAASTATERRNLLGQNSRLTDVKLADEIRKICYSSWTVEPLTAQKAAAAMRSLSLVNTDRAIKAASLWVDGISDITKGRFSSAATFLSDAAELLGAIGQPDNAAQAQVAQLLALAMLGKYDEATETGKAALSVFLRNGDHLDAGKIEMNLSNIVSRQMRHAEAEKYCLSALSHFIRAKEKSWQAMAENGLANTYAELNDFKKAAQFYEKALRTARSQKMLVTEAEIEASLGNLSILRGSYSEALNYLENSRQKYDELGMPHQSAIADLEIADIYLELNLNTESNDIYERTAPIFSRLRMRAEEARTRLNYARSLERQSQHRAALGEIKKALRLFESEMNRSGRASALLAKAEFEIGQNLFAQSLKTLAEAAIAIERAENPRHLIYWNLLRATALKETNEIDDSAVHFTAAERLARRHGQVNSLQAALNGLGRVSAKRGETTKAKRFFTRSIEAVEELRASLSADEFSRSFLAARHDSFDGLAGLFLSEGRIADAFRTVERGRSRSLLDSMELRGRSSHVPKKLLLRQGEMRAELDFYYKKLATAADTEIAQVRADIKRSETDLANISRQIESLVSVERKGDSFSSIFKLESLQKQLSGSRTLIEFVEFNGSISAFVVTGRSIDLVADLGKISDVNEKLDDLHFQFGSMRYGDASLRFADQFKKRTDRVLSQLYEQLLRPLEKYFAGASLIVVPVGPLNYIPFQALHDGNGYVLERFEVGYAPSAAIWMKLDKKRRDPIRTSLLMGFADETIPLVEAEVRKIRKILPGVQSFIGAKAMVRNFAKYASDKDVIHLACHGQFRPDNPMFSSLHLADGWITVRDIAASKLSAGLVTLSACETGRNTIFAGDEILGLARGFLMTGAASIIVSLWNVNDSATSQLMSSLYSHLMSGKSAGISLREAQIELIGQNTHPFYWSPFIKIGR